MVSSQVCQEKDRYLLDDPQHCPSSQHSHMPLSCRSPDRVSSHEAGALSNVPCLLGKQWSNRTSAVGRLPCLGSTLCQHRGRTKIGDRLTSRHFCKSSTKLYASLSSTWPVSKVSLPPSSCICLPLGYSQSISKPCYFTLADGIIHTSPSRQLTIKTKVQHQPRGSFSEPSASGFRACRLGKIGRVGPSTDRQQNFQLSILLFEQEQLLDASVDISADVIPGVRGIVLLDVGPGVRQVHFSGLRSDIGECIEDMGQFICREILGVVIAPIDRLFSIITL